MQVAAPTATTAAPAAPTAPVAEHDVLFKYVTREKESFWKGELSETIFAAWKVGDQLGYASLDDALAAAKVFSQGEMPTVAIVRDGARFALRGTAHSREVMYGVNPTGESKQWKFDDYDAAKALRVTALNPALVGLVDDSWNLSFTPESPTVRF